MQEEAGSCPHQAKNLTAEPDKCALAKNTWSPVKRLDQVNSKEFILIYFSFLRLVVSADSASLALMMDGAKISAPVQDTAARVTKNISVIDARHSQVRLTVILFIFCLFSIKRSKCISALQVVLFV